MAAADLDPLDLEDRTLGMELAAGELERLQDRHDLLDARDRLQRLDLELGLVADDADDGPRNPLAQMRRETQCRDPLEDVLHDLGRRVRLQNNDHRNPRRATRRDRRHGASQDQPGGGRSLPAERLCQGRTYQCNVSNRLPVKDHSSGVRASTVFFPVGRTTQRPDEHAKGLPALWKS